MRALIKAMVSIYNQTFIVSSRYQFITHKNPFEIFQLFTFLDDLKVTQRLNGFELF